MKIVSNMTNQSLELDLMFHALADETRRGMLMRLTKGPATVGDLAGPIEMALPTILRHLKVLEDGGLIRSRKDGRVRTCELEPAGLALAERWIAERRAMWERRLDRLGDVLAEFTQNNDTGDDK